MTNDLQEYIVWQVFDQKIDWFRLVDGDYISFLLDPQGVICSVVFPGLWLDVSAMLQGDMQRVLAILQTGINSADRQTFVQQLIEQQQRHRDAQQGDANPMSE